MGMHAFKEWRGLLPARTRRCARFLVFARTEPTGSHRAYTACGEVELEQRECGVFWGYTHSLEKEMSTLYIWRAVCPSVLEGTRCAMIVRVKGARRRQMGGVWGLLRHLVGMRLRGHWHIHFMWLKIMIGSARRQKNGAARAGCQRGV